MPSGSGQMLPVLTLSRRLGSKNSLLAVGLSRGHDFIQRILEKDAFKPVAEVPCLLLSRASPRFLDVALFTQDPHRQPAKQLARRRQREMRRRSEEHTSELQSLAYLVCRLLLEKKKIKKIKHKINTLFYYIAT